MVLVDSEMIAADAYVFRDEYLHLTDNTLWDPRWFAREGLAAFLGYYKGL